MNYDNSNIFRRTCWATDWHLNITQNAKQKFKSQKSQNKQICCFFGLEIWLCHFWLLIAQPHHVRLKGMEHKHIRYEIALNSNGTQMVKGTKQIWGNELLKKIWKFHVSHFIFILTIICTLHANFQQKIHAGYCYWCKIGVKWPICSNTGTSFLNFI